MGIGDDPHNQMGKSVDWDPVPCMLSLTFVLQAIDDALNHPAIAEQDFVLQKHQDIGQVLLDFGAEEDVELVS